MTPSPSLLSRLLVIYGPALLATFGFAWALGSSKLSLVWRNALAHLSHVSLDPRITSAPRSVRIISSFLLDLIECPACFSFWIGLAVGRAHFGLAGLSLLCYAFVSLAVSLVLGSVARDYEE